MISDTSKDSPWIQVLCVEFLLQLFMSEHEVHYLVWYMINDLNYAWVPLAREFISYFLSSDDKCRFRLSCLINFIPHWLSLTWVIVGVISEGWKLVVVVTVGDINHGYLRHHWLWRRHGGHPWHPPAISLSILLMSVVCRLPIILRFQLSANLVSRKRFSN